MVICSLFISTHGSCFQIQITVWFSEGIIRTPVPHALAGQPAPCGNWRGTVGDTTDALSSVVVGLIDRKAGWLAFPTRERERERASSISEADEP
jgi:hypothetical protein